MGVPFDFFGEESQPKFEIQLMAKNKLSLKSIENRLLLRYVMASAGFLPISNEWWHFNCATDSIVRERYKIIE
jgi:D-alanyl-D-alanine dipeptidase